MVVTSATLTDGTGDVEQDWLAASVRTGAVHMAWPALRASVPSPFDYPARTRVMVVNDVRKDDLAQVAAAYRELFLAAGGGALGCSRRSAGSAPSTSGSPSRWNWRGCCSTASMSMGWTSRP